MEFVTTQKGGKMLLYEGFKYTVNRNGKDNKVYWRCHIRKCPGRAVSDGEQFVSSTTHDHDADGAFTAVEKIKHTLRQKCMTQTRDTVCKVYNTALEEIAELEPANRDAVSTYMPTFNSFGSSLYRARQRMYPALPTTRQTIQLEGKWTETLNHERFLLADDGDADQRIIIFATDQMLHRLTIASTLYMDGTFKACPKLFYQLFSIHIFIEGVQFPALYALLPGKSRDVYSRFFMLLLTKLQDLQLVLQPTRILTDFELALVQSVQLAFPTSHIAGCYYHYQQCIWRWVSMKGHTVLYRQHGDFYNFIRETAALAFVPPEHVRLAWGCLQMKFGPLCTNCPPALDFSNYFKQTWMTGSFPIAMWNHHTTTEERTNNHLEGWHYRFNTLAGKPHPNIYQLIHLLQREDGVTEIKVNQLQNGGLPPPRRKKHVVSSVTCTIML